MADPPPSPTQPGPTTTPTPPQPGPPPPPQQHQTLTPPPLQNPNPNNINPNPNPTLPITPFPGSGAPVVQPSFRPLPQFSPLLNYQGTPTAGVGVLPPGVGVAMPNSVPSVPPVVQYQVPVPGRPPNPRLRPPFAPFPNGYVPPAQGTVAPPGSACFPSLYPAMVRPLYPIHPPGAQVVLPTVSRPPMPGIVGVRPIIPPIIRPTGPSITPAEKPQTTVYIGKISPTVEDDFMLSLLQLCGLVKSWKRVQDPSGTPRGFGFCEFESAEGVLRALRLLNKFNIDGQELVLNVNQATRGYLERYVEKKSENSRNLKETQAAGADEVGGNASSDEKNEPLKSAAEDSNNDSDKDKDNHDVASFGIVTDEDKEGDREAVEKLTSIIEERIKTKPLPPPPPPPPAIADGSGNQTLGLQAKSRDGDTIENDSAEDKIDDETTSDNKAASERDGPDTSSPDRSRRNDRRSRDRERDLKREQERELERYEREAERERVRKEREQRRRIEGAEREFEERLRDWEYREKEKERQRHLDKEREKERERKRRKEIQYDEDDEEDDRKRWHRSVSEERRRKRLQEKKEDLADRLQEEEEIAEAKRKAEEEKQLLQQRDISKFSVAHVINGGEKALVPEEASDKAAEPDYEPDSGNENHKGDGILQNGVGDESTIPSVSESDTQQIGIAPTKKLGFGLVGSGKRATVLSVFNEEDDDEARKDKKMRPLVPIDYSTEELQAIQPTVYGGQPPNLAAAAEYAKRISNVTPKEKFDAERERSRRSHDRSSQWERDHNNVGHAKDENRKKALERDRDRENGVEKLKTADKQKLLDAKQLIDMIPKTKDELFLYEINWSVYDKHELHDRMRPWISKKITEFLGEEETTLVDYIVSSTQEHIQASQMLEMLQSILDDEAEMFVLKMWRMLIFEIKKVETGLALRS